METDLECEKSSEDDSADSSDPLMQHIDSTDDEYDAIAENNDDDGGKQEEKVESAEENAVSVVEISKHLKKDTPLDTKETESECSHNNEFHTTEEALKVTESVLHQTFSEKIYKERVEKVEENIVCLHLTAKRPSILEEHFHDLADNESAKTASECYFSAQDFLEYGALLPAAESKTPDLESGYYERSESDISRDDIELSRVSKDGPHRQALSTMSSEGLRQELNRFRAMIDIMERERMNNNMQMNLQETVESVLSYEENYSETMQIETQAKTDKKLEIEGNNERGYWSTVFGQASKIESAVELTLDERFADIQSRI